LTEKTRSKEECHAPKAAKQAIRMPTMEDFLPPSIPEADTAAPPPGIVVELCEFVSLDDERGDDEEYRRPQLVVCL
jgi:hypothetical protein